MTVVAGAWTCDQNVALSLLYKYPTLRLSRDHNRTLKFLSKTHQPDSKWTLNSQRLTFLKIFTKF